MKTNCSAQSNTKRKKFPQHNRVGIARQLTQLRIPHPVRSLLPLQNIAPTGDFSTAAKFASLRTSHGVAETEPDKVNTQKENTQTQDAPAASVRVGSKFTLEECRRYAKHLQSTGQGINNPGGYATTIHRTGEADILIESYLHPGAAGDASANLDTSQCPDCNGTGFYYPQGTEGGVARCKHVRLREGSEE